MYNENKTLGEVLSNSFSNLLSSAGSGIKSLFTDNREQEALAFQHDEVKETPFEWSSLKVIRWIFQITTGYLSYYGAMHILKEPIVAVSPENGLLIARVISLFLVVAFEIAVFATTKRATFHWLKTTHKHYKNVGKALVFTALLGGLCYVSWRAAQEGAEDIVVSKTDQSGVIIDKKVGDLEILKSQYKTSRASVEKMHNESVKSAEKSLSSYMADVTKWKDPKSIRDFNTSITSAKNERRAALDRIDADYKQDKAEIETGAQKPLADNSAKQSIYQRNIWWFSILLEFFRCLCVYLVVKGVYLYTPSRPQQRRQERFDMPEPQIFAEKKTFNHIPTPIVMEEEEEVRVVQSPISHAAPSESTTNPLEEYARAMNNRNKLRNDFKNHFTMGKLSYEVLAGRWEKNEARIKAVCEQLGQPYISESIPTNPNKQKLP